MVLESSPYKYIRKMSQSRLMESRIFMLINLDSMKLCFYEVPFCITLTGRTVRGVQDKIKDYCLSETMHVWGHQIHFRPLTLLSKNFKVFLSQMPPQNSDEKDDKIILEYDSKILKFSHMIFRYGRMSNQ